MAWLVFFVRSCHLKAIYQRAPAINHLISIQKDTYHSKIPRVLCQEPGTKSTYFNKSCSYHPVTQEITKLLGTLCQEPGRKTKYIVLITLQYHNKTCHSVLPVTKSLSCFLFLYFFYAEFWEIPSGLISRLLILSSAACHLSFLPFFAGFSPPQKFSLTNFFIVTGHFGFFFTMFVDFIFYLFKSFIQIHLIFCIQGCLNRFLLSSIDYLSWWPIIFMSYIFVGVLVHM